MKSKHEQLFDEMMIFRGKLVVLGSLVCFVDAGIQFETNEQDQRHEVKKQQNNQQGSYLTVKFVVLSKIGDVIALTIYIYNHFFIYHPLHDFFYFGRNGFAKKL